MVFVRLALPRHDELSSEVLERRQGGGSESAWSFPVRSGIPCKCKMTTDDAEKRLLDILEAHGQKFLDSFKPHKAEENGRKRAAEDTAEFHRSTKLLRAETDQSESSPVDDYSDSAEEWSGLGDDAQIDGEYEVCSSADEAVPVEGALCSGVLWRTGQVY